MKFGFILEYIFKLSILATICDVSVYKSIFNKNLYECMNLLLAIAGQTAGQTFFTLLWVKKF